MIFYTSNNSFEIGKSKASSLILFWHDKELDKGNGLGLVNDIYQERAYNGDNYECFADGVAPSLWPQRPAHMTAAS